MRTNELLNEMFNTKQGIRQDVSCLKYIDLCLCLFVFMSTCGSDTLKIFFKKNHMCFFLTMLLSRRILYGIGMCLWQEVNIREKKELFPYKIID